MTGDDYADLRIRFFVHGLQKATLRVHVLDWNKVFTNSLIGDFDCYVGGNVGTSMQNAKWTSAGNCVGKYIPDKIKYVD